MTRRFVKVKRFKRGATWDDGSTRTCTRCRVDKVVNGRRVANQATVTAIDVTTGSRLPVAYCDHHIPEEISQ